MVILGIDPGSIVTGYGVVEHQRRRNRLVTSGFLRPNPRLPFSQRLLCIYDELLDLISDVSPDEVALESVFFGANVQTMMKMCHARGVILLALANSDTPVYEYSPREVKRAVVGKGSATKEQVQFMIHRLFKDGDPSDRLDVTDAIAIAVCHTHQMVSPLKGADRSKNPLLAKIDALKATDSGGQKLDRKLKAMGVDAQARKRTIRAPRQGR